MKNFTYEEVNLMALYNTGNRERLIEVLTEMRSYLTWSEVELRDLTDSTLDKLAGMTDAEDEKDSKWQCYIIPDLATWTGAAGSKPYTPIEFYNTYEQAVDRFRELRSEPYNSEDLPGARLTFGVQREDPPSAADLLHVRQGKNYLVDDYTRMASLNQSSEVMDILRQMRKERPGF